MSHTTSYLMTELIKLKRDGCALSRDQIHFIIENYTSGVVPDYQMSAFLMATYLKGMSAVESAALTHAMLHSGDIVDMSHITKVKVDKHSTGGVGDKTSLILGPIVAAADVAVPMISGRGLGHTGGTLDKLESIPGFNTQLDLETFKRLTSEHGVCFIGQTKEICPADKKIYALRDVTGTIESFPLICASIMSKKIAEGIDALVLDIKFGTGAFMKSAQDAERLADALIAVGAEAGKRVVALLTNMNEPLGRFVGNALEVEECLAVLKNEDIDQRFKDTRALSLELAGAMIWLGQRAVSFDEGLKKATRILDSGRAYEVFEKICRVQGGDLTRLPRANHKKDIVSQKSGFVSGYQNENIGIASLMMGAGRRKVSDAVDPVAGIEIHKKLGDPIQKGETLFTLYASQPDLFYESENLLINSVAIADTAPETQPLILKRKFGT